MTLVACTTLAASASIESGKAATPTESNVETFDSSAVQNLPEQLPLTIQLPRQESSIPFFQPQPISYLSAPPQFASNPQPNFYQVPIPSEFLTAPTQSLWNPNNDPTLYYELPPVITKENTPTSEFPKKFIKEVHSKGKPLSLLPKQEIALEPISESLFMQKQKDLYKTIEKLNKKENTKQVEKEKVPRTSVKPLRIRNSKTRPIDSTTRETKLKPSTHVKKGTVPKVTDSASSDSSYEHNKEQYDPNKFSRGLSPEITDSLGISTNHGEDGERLLFHMVGQDGPMSYKWGYDTGKG